MPEYSKSQTEKERRRDTHQSTEAFPANLSRLWNRYDRVLTNEIGKSLAELLLPRIRDLDDLGVWLTDGEIVNLKHVLVPTDETGHIFHGLA